MNGADFLKSKGITQAQVARELNCRRNNVSIWFCGSQSPRVDSLIKLTDALNKLGADTNYNEVFRVITQSRKEYLARKRG